MPRPRSCPICLSTGQRRQLYHQQFLEGPLCDQYDVVICAECGAGFADEIPSQVTMDHYYAEQSKYAYAEAGGTESPWDFMRFESAVEQVSSHLPLRQARILDIGCATGGLLSVFRRHGYGDVLGVDPSAICAQAARRLHDIPVRVATLAELAGWSDRFDLVLMTGVLEHLRDVRAAVATAARLLAPGGLLYCSVPDVEGLADCANAPYQQFSVEHVNFFSSTSLNRVMATQSLAQRQNWRWAMEWREGVGEPIVSGLYEPSAMEKKLPFDKITEPALERYLTFSAIGDQKLRRVVETLRRSQEPLLIWGAGTLSRRLLATMRLAETNIRAFVDSNPSLQGRHLAGRVILAPAEIRGRNEAILVASQPFEKEIVALIRIQLGLKNPIITFTGNR